MSRKFLTMSCPATLAVGGAILAAAKALSVAIIADAYAATGGEWWLGAAAAAAAVAPAAAIEAAMLTAGYRFARRSAAGPAFDARSEREVERLAVLSYACFFAAGLGLTGAGWLLGIGMAVAAPVLAPLAPLAVSAAVMKLLAAALRKGAAYEDELKDTV